MAQLQQISMNDTLSGNMQYYIVTLVLMEQRAFKNVNNCLNTNIYFYLDTSVANVIKLFTA